MIGDDVRERRLFEFAVLHLRNYTYVYHCVYNGRRNEMRGLC